MNRILNLLPELEGDEMIIVNNAIKDFTDDEAQTFANIYRARRKDPQIILVMCLVGLFVIPGLQRFFINQIGMGILYLFTVGLCFIGSIVDLINYKKLTQEYNRKIMFEVLGLLKIS